MIANLPKIKLINQIIYLAMKSNIDDKCQEVFKEIKFKKAHRYVSYKVDQERVVIDQIGQRGSNWGLFMKSLPPKEPRMAVFDLEFTNNDGMNVSKLFFLYWLPDGTPLKIKLLYATNKESFKTSLDVGSGKEIVVNSADDLTLQELIKEFQK